MPRRQTVTDSPEATALDQATKEQVKAEQAAETKRAALYKAIRKAYDSGMTVSEIARRTPYTREHVSFLLNGKGDKPPLA